MKHHVVAVFDSAMQAYGRPFFVPALQMAIRSFGDEINRKAPDNQFAAHPDDYELFHLAVFDEETGTFENVQARSLGRGKDLAQP